MRNARAAILIGAVLLFAGFAFAADTTAQLERRIRDLEARLAKQDKKAEEMKLRLSAEEKKIAERRAKVKSLEDVRRKNVNDEQVAKLRRATKAQEDISARIDLLRKILENDEPELQRLVQTNRVENALVAKDASVLKMSDAYELAKELEAAITESYKDIKATQTAIERKMSFNAAQKITDVAKAVRLEADRTVIEGSPRTKEALDAQKIAQTAVVREADNIVETTVAMMQEALEIVMSDDSSENEMNGAREKKIAWLQESDFEKRSKEEARKRRLEQMSAAADYQVAISAAAAEDEQERAKDLTKVMEDAAEVVKNTDAAELAQAVAAAQTSAAQSPAPGELSPLDVRNREVLGGNVINFSGCPSSGGLPAKWMYVQDWYVIGPFPNPNRVNLRRKFPPESVVDLDATYVGKDGRTVKWEFMQTMNSTPKEAWRAEGKATAVPPTAEEYGIWYAYAEVFSDIECDRWIAVGSDDRSDIWINDVPVWGSSSKLKQWRIDEGYRRIHLNKGRNRILARIENGWMNLSWSVCISVEDGRLGLTNGGQIP